MNCINCQYPTCQQLQEILHLLRWHAPYETTHNATCLRDQQEALHLELIGLFTECFQPPPPVQNTVCWWSTRTQCSWWHPFSTGEATTFHSISVGGEAWKTSAHRVNDKEGCEKAPLNYPCLIVCDGRWRWRCWWHYCWQQQKLKQHRLFCSAGWAANAIPKTLMNYYALRKTFERKCYQTTWMQ